jgi:hypothetical protein
MVVAAAGSVDAVLMPHLLVSLAATIGYPLEPAFEVVDLLAGIDMVPPKRDKPRSLAG